MIRPFKWIGDLLFQNLGWKLLSLAIAVVIWALVATEPELATFANVRLEYKNLPEGSGDQFRTGEFRDARTARPFGRTCAAWGRRFTPPW